MSARSTPWKPDRPLCSRLLALLPAALLLTGCNSTPPRADHAAPIREHVEQALEQNRANAPAPATIVPRGVPDAVNSALLPPLSPDVAPGEEPRYDISVNNLSAPAFFMGLVEGTALNMVLHPEVTGSVSLNLKNVTIDEVMETARDVYGYDYRRTATGYQVMPVRIRSKVYYVDYLNIQRTGTSTMRVQSGRQDGGGGTSTVGSEINTTQPESTFWTELASSVTAIIGEGTGRSVAVNPQAGVVVVRAMPMELREVEEYLARIQESVNRQVILEAKILEVELSDGFRSGINWAAIGEVGRNKTIFAGMLGGGSAIDNGVSSLVGGNVTLNTANPTATTGLTTDTFGGVFTLALNLKDFQGFIELLESQGSVRVLSSPRVATINNQKAVIKVGTDEYFVTNVDSSTSDAGNTSADIELTPFFSGVALDVTPQIDRAGLVTLHIHPSVMDVSDQSKTFTVNGQAQTLPLALSSTRESDSIVRAASGQVVVIGGLLKDQKRTARVEPPVLSDLPYVGWAFRHDQEISVKSELVILLRPLVVSSREGWNAPLRESAENMKKIRR